MSQNWIAGAIQHPGALHDALGVPHGTPIPQEALERALAGDYGEHVRKMAQLAKTLGGFRHGQ